MFKHCLTLKIQIIIQDTIICWLELFQIIQCVYLILNWATKQCYMIFHRFYWIYLFKKRTVNKKRKTSGWSRKMCCARGCGKWNFLLNTQYLEPSFKELFAQDIYLNDIRGRIFFIINNHSKENCTCEEKVAHQQLTYPLHRQILACQSSCINRPRQVFGNKSVPNPKQVPEVVKHIY